MRRFEHSLLVLLVLLFSAAAVPEHVDLQRDRLSHAYRARLRHAGQHFSWWCAKQGTTMTALSSRPAEMNNFLVKYLQMLYSSGLPLWRGTHTVLAVQTIFRSLCGKLRVAWKSTMTRRLLRPVRFRVPLPAALLEALCRYCILAALSLDAAHFLVWWNFAVMLHVGFFGLFRPKEIWGVT